MTKNQHIKFAKSKHLKQLKRNAKKKILRLQRSQIKIAMRRFKKTERTEPATGSDLIDLI